ncbi:LysR family transcriptional regulator [Saccharothrix violaceirubra]|uniref:DNA-binding transcriptional LysR family regulator n=1 Tax=Saccharothrix violaceirubra TaxID=413306 RepID=A0A7W7TA94_9PSEU|nr:LysR family transcriptional regulator [Saccharothrix violaceirubra]MBB4969418.1 DNA-binding transcriptional LysR family regulator [Saccharothrix violaceirubra]
MDVRQLVAFRAVAETRSITRAATALGYSQSAVTAQIKNLESVVRARLFERRRDGVRLTSSGERFLPYVTRLLRLTEEARSAVAPEAEPRGTLTIGASEAITTYRLPDVVWRFHARHPDVRLALHTFHEGPQSLVTALERGEIDVALLHSTGPVGPASRRLAVEELVLVAAPTHSLVGRDVVTVDDLREQSTLIVQSACVYDAVMRAELGHRPVPPLEYGTIEGAKIAAVAGHGVALLPRVCVRSTLDEGRLVALPWMPVTTVAGYLVWDDAQCDPATLAALDAVLTRAVADWERPRATAA